MAGERRGHGDVEDGEHEQHDEDGDERALERGPESG
jgi:hypothetical protein